MKVKIAPSIMCCDFIKLEECIKNFEKVGVDYIHFDVMDGHFVPNFTMGADILRSIRAVTKIPIDIHLMVERPENFIDMFEPREGDMISVHLESTYHIQKVLKFIKDKGCKASIALNPGTPICMIEDVIDVIDAVLIMTVNPGFTGQQLVPRTLQKISRLREMLDNEYGFNDVEIEVDGSVTYDNARKMKSAGANIFVVGTSSVLNKDVDFFQAYKTLQKSIA